MVDTLPSAPAVVLPTTLAYGTARRAIVVYSDRLWLSSFTRIITLPASGAFLVPGTDSTGVRRNVPGYVGYGPLSRTKGPGFAKKYFMSESTTSLAR